MSQPDKNIKSSLFNLVGSVTELVNVLLCESRGQPLKYRHGQFFHPEKVVTEQRKFINGTFVHSDLICGPVDN
jgi:hypothetical protein